MKSIWSFFKELADGFGAVLKLAVHHLRVLLHRKRTAASGLQRCCTWAVCLLTTWIVFATTKLEQKPTPHCMTMWTSPVALMISMSELTLDFAIVPELLMSSTFVMPTPESSTVMVAIELPKMTSIVRFAGSAHSSVSIS
eukprot:CAMPEP_0177425432 /NCGR_PEP_ID=MMETSP0368-20130122/73011_1 /TAXON_ID=447022 ORGANISM="Scrippsiella hangoei-like, Strain SHHI-4" /NCGR_SAMPLE_ID=MMETSP0368 /ASSEMBLY_ACC=CAM_ASM_000363 /LENGTH=139 /DNA_ID=CAMNT_0018895741 /DNA_START=135 /DNA_END=551 /DNA_ORIENTATION=-